MNKGLTHSLTPSSGGAKQKANKEFRSVALSAAKSLRSRSVGKTQLQLQSAHDERFGGAVREDLSKVSKRVAEVDEVYEDRENADICCFRFFAFFFFSEKGLGFRFVGRSINLQCGGTQPAAAELAEDAKRTTRRLPSSRGHFIISARGPFRLSRKNSGTAFPARHE